MKIKYSLEHNWIELKRKVVTIGITDYFAEELGDLIDLCLPKVSEEIIFGISYGEIESINILHDLIAPLSGEIVKVNSDLVASLKILQKDPFDTGWLIKVRIADHGQLDTLMDEDEYEEYRKSNKGKEKEAGKKKQKGKIKEEVDGKKKKEERKKKAESNGEKR